MSFIRYGVPNVRRLPTHVWLRLRGELKDLLAEQENDNLRWYHHQLKETAEERFDTAEKVYYYELLGHYFASNESEPGLLLARNISLNPIVLSNDYEFTTSCRDSFLDHVALLGK